jgi:hypothetical protein
MLMGTKDIWYGVLEAGDKTSPVVRDMSLEVSDTKRIWLYNHVKNQFVEYSLEIVEPKLRNLGNGDISLDELDQAFKSARKAFGLARKIRKWDNKTSAATVAQVDNDEPDIDLEDGDIEDYIDDD